MEGEVQSPGAETRHRCYLCSRTYERHDHLSRHLKSHDNKRSYRCPGCGKGFNRADLLNRHRAAHAKTSSGDVFRRRTPRACEACIKAKTRCDDQRPCKRCKTREIPCLESESRNDSRDDHSKPGPVPAKTGAQLGTPASLPQQLDELAISNSNLAGLTPFQVSTDPFATNVSMAEFGFPDFFEQIMMPDMANVGTHDHLIMPPNVTNFTQDVNIDAFDLDFNFLASGLTRPSTPHGHRNDLHSNDATGFTSHSDAHLRAEAFKKSPWSWNHWIPERNHNAFSGQEEINIQEDRVNATDQQVSPSINRAVHCELDQASRDHMIRIVTQVTCSKLAMPSFPSLELLEDLIDVFLLQDNNAIDTYIHASSFSCRDARTELLLAMVSAGSRYIALAPVWKMGLVIQEVVRLAMAEVFEGDNSTTRELQAQQAYMLWLSVGVWSGFRRKTEIASSFLQPAVTMLTWSNAFTKFRYQDFVPYPDDSDEVLNVKWKAWLEQEGRKRVVLHTFLHDSQVAIAHMQNRLISPAQMMLPVPACLDLWLAPNAHSWRSVYLSKQPPLRDALPSVMEVFGNLAVLDNLEHVVDKPLCILTACHALAGEVWWFRQRAQLLSNWQAQGRRDRWLGHINRQRAIFDDLELVSAYCQMSDTSPEILFTIEFLSMSLHVSLEDILLFSGKSGEEEARNIYPRVRAWTQDVEARTAVWHAGQVLRVARTFEKTRLRDFYAIAVYQAILTLWVYGMVTSNTARKSGEKTPTQGGRTSSTVNGLESLTQGHRIYLDDSGDKAAKSFKLLGQGIPGLKSPPSWNRNGSQAWNAEASFCSLHNSKSVMLVAEDILKQNFPESRNGLPPLVENLANLMSELGRLSGK